MEDWELMDPTAPRHITLPADQQRRKTLIVGDVHGCADELRDLLALHYRQGDTLILAGDLVNKGPKSEEVVPLARKLGALAVVGNHELAVLRGRHARQQHGAAAKNSRYEWTDQMSEEDVEYVRSLPYTISLPLHNSVVVHAGLVPGVPLKQQNPNDMVTMRTLQPRLDGSGYVVSDKNERGATPWAQLNSGPVHVYFGHDAARKLQCCRHATGLDTGCLYGGSLTAAVLELGKSPRLVSVPARSVYVQPGGGTKRGNSMMPSGVRASPMSSSRRRGVSTLSSSFAPARASTPMRWVALGAAGITAAASAIVPWQSRY